MSLVRSIGAWVPVVFASSVALADDPPGAPVSSAAPASSESAAPPPTALPANAPIVLSPGVAAKPAKHVVAEPVATRHSERQWFGYQTLVADIAIVGAAAVFLRTTSTSNHLAIVIGGSALYLGIGPLLHYAHKSGRVGSSLLLRGVALGVGATLGALLISGFAGCAEATPCKLELIDFAAIGAGVGAMVGTIVDSSAYAWKITPATTAYLQPTVARVPGGATFGLTIAY